MTFVAFIFGSWTSLIVLGALWFLRERERTQAFNALRRQNEQLSLRAAEAETLRGYNDLLRADSKRMEHRLDDLREFARRVRISNLGGSVSLPDPARRTRQRTTDRISDYVEKRLPGPPLDGPRFLGNGR